MNTLRREYLKIVGAITAAISAAFGGVWYVFDDDDEDQGDDSTDAQRRNRRNDSRQRGRETDKQQAENSSQNESQQSQNESQHDNESSDANETTDTNESDEDKSTEEVVPDENETRPDDPPESSNPDEDRERVDEDAVTIENKKLSVRNYGAAQVAGSIRNVSDQRLDIVTLEIVYFDGHPDDPNSSEIGAGSDSVNDLESGESDSFGHSVGPDGLRGVPEAAVVIPRPFINTGDDS